MKKHLFTCFLIQLCLVGSDLKAQSKVAESPPGTDLVYQPGIPGQEGESPSARLEGMLYIEIPASSSPDTLKLTYWEELLSESPSVSPGKAIPLVAQKGTFFEGSGNMKAFTFSLPQSMDQGFFSLSNGQVDLIKHWSFNASDRVRIRFDQGDGLTLFGGPQADFYRTQYLLDQAIAEARFNSSPLLIAGRSEGLFENTSSAERYKKAMQRPDDLYVKLKVLVPKESGWEHLKEYLLVPFAQHPAWIVLQGYKERLTPLEYQSLEARVKGAVLLEGVARAEFATEQLKEAPEKATEFLDWAHGLELERVFQSHPQLIEAAVGLAVIEAGISETIFFGVLDRYPSKLKDKLIGHYMLSNFNRLGDNLAETLDKSISIVRTPWISEELIALRDVQLGGFIAKGLYNEQGESVDLTNYRGKTLLIHYWISGCKFCIDDYQRVLTPLEVLLEEGSAGSDALSASDVILVTINADSEEETWRNSLNTGRYTSDQFLNLKAEKGSEVLSRYGIIAFPQKMIIGPDSKVRMQTLHSIDPNKLYSILDSIQTQIPQQITTSFNIQP